MSEAKYREALQRIANWNEHATDYAISFGSNGVRDYYRAIATEALAQPTEALELTDVEAEMANVLRSFLQSDYIKLSHPKRYAAAKRVVDAHEAKRSKS